MIAKRKPFDKILAFLKTTSEKEVKKNGKLMSFMVLELMKKLKTGGRAKVAFEGLQCENVDMISAG